MAQPSLGRCLLALPLAVLVLTEAVAQAGDPNLCDAPGDAPDVIVGSIHAKERWGEVAGITAFSLGTTSCNVGTCWLNWEDFSNKHPVINQAMYRLKNGRFEQLGQSWVKHGFFALNQEFCSTDCIKAPTGAHLGVLCSDPYSTFLNAKQDELGPKFEVNAATGFHPHPVTNQGQTGDAIFKRLQVYNDDLDPALNPGALYFVEAQYVAEDDAGAGNKHNNASHRPVVVSTGGGVLDFSFSGPTVQEEPAIREWPLLDPGVDQVDIDVPGDGRLILSAKATELGGGVWHYEYAIHNLNSHRSVGTFTVPIPAGVTVTNIGFHDVDYHSGEPYSGTDWTNNGGAGLVVQWSTTPIAVDPNANALRWATLYNFRFDANVPPGVHDVSLGLFRPGVPASMTATTVTPSLCDNDESCDTGEDCGRCPSDCADGTCGTGESVCNCPADCGAPLPEASCVNLADDDCDQLQDCFDADCCDDAHCAGPDTDGDSFVGCGDCDEGNATAWATPGEVRNLILASGPSGTVLSWSPPLAPGASSVTYEVLRARNPSNFVLNTTCLAPTVPTGTSMVDAEVPAVGMFSYLVRALDDCPAGVGTLGAGSDGVPRQGKSCPP